MKYGAKFSEEGKPVSDDENVIYTSDRDQFKVNIIAQPPHLYLLDPLKKMTNLTVSSTSQLASEILFQVKHNMPFKPSVWLYMNMIDAPATESGIIGGYVTDFYRPGRRIIYVEADDTFVYIKHDFYFNGTVGAPDPQTETDADVYKIRAKLLISNARYVGQIARNS